MTLIKWKPEPTKVYDEFDSMIKTIFNTEWPLKSHNRSKWMPATDIKETDKSYIIKVDIAGLTKKDIQVTIVNQLLTISGERKEELNESDNYFHYRERLTGSFNRSFNLPDTVNQDKISANFNNGTLIIKLEKNAEIPLKEKSIKIN